MTCNSSTSECTKKPLFPAATITGYPRIGADRQLKRALESFWAGRSDADALRETAKTLRTDTLKHLQTRGLTEPGAVPADFAYYDQVLSAAVAVDAIPARFAHLRKAGQPLSLDAIFKVARGHGDLAAAQMTKWFDSNYHYLVPEISPDTVFRYASKHFEDYVREAAATHVAARPVIVGPVTFLLLSRPADDGDFDPLSKLPELTEVYAQVLAGLAAAGATWVQLDEPALCCDTWNTPRARVLAATEAAYRRLATTDNRPALAVALTYGSAPDAAVTLAKLGVEALILDLVRGQLPCADTLTSLGETGVQVAAGVVSGRNIWRTDLAAALSTLKKLRDGLAASGNTPHVAVTTSTSLQHVPYDAARETALDPQLRSWLAFADQKVREVVVLAAALQAGSPEAAGAEITAEFEADHRIRAERAAHPGTNRPKVRAATAGVTDADRTRVPYAERDAIQRERLNLPLLPTTTIGSFPQTAQIRTARAAFRRGELDGAGYRDAMRNEIAHVIHLQEELGLDVLVHGEAERNDMVQYFAENLEGFATTTHGWVQSYGSRCTRPSILWGDVTRPRPITVDWISYAQSLTDKPVKGMLTGPVTILAWSFVRDDLPLGQVADQVALALRGEVADLEAAGTPVIQVDEPAIRELLPLRGADRDAYLAWSVGAFRLATAGAAASTQIHTHLCYSEFSAVIDAVDRLDADVTSIEASRSRMAVLPAIGRHGFERQIGPGVWDIHSPRVPSQAECESLIRAALTGVKPQQLWVNPDCGLKTRAYAEVEASLRNLVAAAAAVRKTLG